MGYESIISLLSRKWTVEILDLLSKEGTLNYSDIEAEFNTSSDVISDRLKTLTEMGLIERTEYTSRDVRYSLTENGSTMITKLSELEELLSGSN